MLDCLIIGDSIAYGVSYIRKECVSYVESGINSHIWSFKYLNMLDPAKTVIISLGTNDLKYVDTYVELDQIRRNIVADRVFWIIPPIKPKIQEIVWKLIEDYGDIALEINYLGKDGVHPTYKGYTDLAERTK